MTDDAERLDALEMRLSEQERVIDDLNVAVAAQWGEVDALRRQVGLLLDRVAEAESRGPIDPEKPPPHY